MGLGGCRPWDVMYHVLSALPGTAGHEACRDLINEVAREADVFWTKIARKKQWCYWLRISFSSLKKKNLSNFEFCLTFV